MALLAGVAGCAYLGDVLMAGKPWPMYDKLAKFTNDTASARIRWPQSEVWSRNLLLAIPIASPTNYPLERVCPPFSGTVRIRDSAGEAVGQYAISPNNAQHCNWLTQHSLDAFIVGWQETNCLKTAMQAGKEYDITVTIPSRPKEFTSLWLEYIQTENQRRQDQRTTGGTVRR